MAGLSRLDTTDKPAEVMADFFPDAKQASSLLDLLQKEPLG
jgi:hypothetical protein